MQFKNKLLKKNTLATLIGLTLVLTGFSNVAQATQQPTITTISPTSGSTLGGTSVTINGTNFANDATLTFGGVAASSVVISNNGKTITATTPAHAAGSVDVTVTNPGSGNSASQSDTNLNGFTYISPTPAVTSISPNSGPDAGGTLVTITGSGYSSGAIVAIGGTAATGVTVISSTSITATTPAHVAGTFDVVVTNPDLKTGTLTNAFTFIDPPAPHVSGISPSTGSTVGGDSVTITGTGFNSGATVTIGGSAATSVTIVSSTSITATTPAHAAGAVDVVVTNTDTKSGTLTSGFTYQTPPNPAPTVTGISPSSGTTTGGTSVTITGTGFLSGATVTFNGAAATGVTVVSSTSITATTPAHAAGAVDVVVTNTDSKFGTLTGGFTYQTPPNPAPTVTGISPATGTTVGGTSVTITGTGFLSGATVTIGGSAATGVTVVSSTSITATTPAHAAGVVDVVVTNTDSLFGTLSGGFTYQTPPNPAPTVTGNSPSSGTTLGGDSVTITGTGFLSGATVTFNSNAATSVTVVSSTSITATTPAHAAGAVDVVVTNADTKFGSLTGGFTYQTPPSKEVVITPTPGKTALIVRGQSAPVDMTYTLTATNFSNLDAAAKVTTWYTATNPDPTVSPAIDSSHTGLDIIIGTRSGNTYPLTLQVDTATVIAGIHLFNVSLDGTSAALPLVVTVLPATVSSGSPASFVPDPNNDFNFAVTLLGPSGASDAIDVSLDFPAGSTNLNQLFQLQQGAGDKSTYRTVAITPPAGFTGFIKPIAITIPKITGIGANVNIGYSINGLNWQLIPQLDSAPVDGAAWCSANHDNAGYVLGASTVTIYTCNLSSFGYRENQATLVAVSSPTSVTAGSNTTLSTTGGSGTGAVTFTTTSSSSICTVSGTTLHSVSAGTCAVTAAKAGDADYFSASSAVLNVTINAVAPVVIPSGGGSGGGYSGYIYSQPAPQPISQPTLNIAAGDPTIQLDKTLSLSISGGGGTGALSFTTSTPTICSVSETGVVTALAVGTCQVQAMKASSGIYLSASSNNLSINISDSEKQAAEIALLNAAAEKAAADIAAAEKAAAEARAVAEAKAAAEAEAAALADAKAAAARLAILNLNQITWKKSGKQYAIKINLAVKYAYEIVTIQIGNKLNGKLVYKTTDWLALNGMGDGVITQSKVPVKGSYYRILLYKNNQVIFTLQVK